MADTLVLEASAERRAGSSPVPGTMQMRQNAKGIFDCIAQTRMAEEACDEASYRLTGKAGGISIEEKSTVNTM